MYIYTLISNLIDVKSSKRIGGNTEARNQKERSTGNNGYSDGRTSYISKRPRQSRIDRRLGSIRQASSIYLRQSEQSIKSVYRKAWQKGTNILVFYSLFFLPFIVKNLTYCMLLDFVCIGYDLQAFNNVGVV